MEDLRVESLRHKLRAREANESIRSPCEEEHARHEIEEDHWTETQKPISEVTVLYVSLRIPEVESRETNEGSLDLERESRSGSHRVLP
jgi:hypothetical protein